MSVDLAWQPLSRDDLPALSGLISAIEHLDDPVDRHSMGELYELHDQAAADPTRHAVVVWADTAPVAYAWNRVGADDVSPRRVWLTGGVHPAWRRRGLGRRLLEWQVQRAREWYAATRRPEHGGLRMIGLVEEKLTGRTHLFARNGFRPLRWYADMSRPLADVPPHLPVPDGLVLVPYTEELTEGVRQAHNEAFADHWGAQPVGAATWAEECRRSAFRPQWSWVAVVDGAGPGEVAGYALNSGYEQDWEATGIREGWTDRLGVRRRWRGHGLGRALLGASLQSFAQAGLDAAGLGVDADNPHGAFRLYESMGYTVGEKVVLYARDVSEQRS